MKFNCVAKLKFVKPQDFGLFEKKILKNFENKGLTLKLAKILGIFLNFFQNYQKKN